MIIKIDITLKNNSEIQELLKDGGKIIKENNRFFIVNKVKCKNEKDIKDLLKNKNFKNLLMFGGLK